MSQTEYGNPGNPQSESPQYGSPQPPQTGGVNPKGRRKGAADMGIPESAWNRVHPVSPVLKSFSTMVAVVVILVFGGRSVVEEVFSPDSQFTMHLPVVFIVVALIVCLLMVLTYSYFLWRVTAYAVTDEAVWYRTGILQRQQNHARLERIQSVDIVHPLLGRIFGLGNISIEAAGGSFTFGYLKTEELERLRAEILARAAGVYSDATAGAAPGIASGVGVGVGSVPGGAGVGAGAPGLSTGVSVPGIGAELGMPSAGSVSGGVDATGVYGTPTGGARAASSSAPAARQPVYVAKAPERELYSVKAGDLLLSLVLQPSIIIIFLFMIATTIGIVIAMIYLGPGILMSLLSLLAPMAIIASLLWNSFASEFGFRAAVSPDGVRTYRGLLQTTAQTIPPHRVHAVEIQQPVLWRSKGWYRVILLQAGKDSEVNSSTTTDKRNDLAANVLLPVGTKTETLMALWLVLPNLGIETPVEEFFEECFQAPNRESRGSRMFRTNPPAARLFDPLVQGRRGLALTDTAMVIRDGWLTRRTSFLPFEHIQSVAVKQGPWERLRGLSNLEACMVQGRMTTGIYHMEAAECAAAAKEVERRSRIRREAQGPERWMSLLQS